MEEEPINNDQPAAVPPPAYRPPVPAQQPVVPAYQPPVPAQQIAIPAPVRAVGQQLPVQGQIPAQQQPAVAQNAAAPLPADPQGAARIHRNIDLIPNTGHHFFSIKFTDNEWQWADAESVAGTTPAHLPWVAYSVDGKEHRWIQGRIAKEGDDIVFSVAIETNRNNAESCRGFLLTQNGVKGPFEEKDIPIEDLKSCYAPELHGIADREFVVQLKPFLQHFIEQYLKLLGEEEGRATGEKRTKINENRVKVDSALAGLGVVSSPVLNIRWTNATSVANTYLVMDFGNSRSMALVLEKPAAGQVVLNSFSSCCKAVQFLQCGKALKNNPETGDTVLESWVLLRPAFFESIVLSSGNSPLERDFYDKGEPTKVKRYPLIPVFLKSKEVTLFKHAGRRLEHCFVEISPTTTSASSEEDSAAVFLFRDKSALVSAKIFHSAIKRFAWAVEEVEIPWNVCDLAKQELPFPLLGGNIRYFMDVDGRDWNFDKIADESKFPPDKRPSNLHPYSSIGTPPTFPLADAITWTGLGLMERSYEQINSNEYRATTPQRKRRLVGVQLTFPSGWCSTELKIYESKWQKAIDVFALSRFENPKITIRTEQVTRGSLPGDVRPVLHTDVDEAVASQLPFVTADLVQLQLNAATWVKLVGRPVDENNSKYKSRVINLDIGGGTSDVSVVDYKNNPQNVTEMQVSPVFRFSSSHAGDEIVKAIIQKVLLPYWAGINSDFGHALSSYFCNPPQNNDFTTRSRCVRLILTPLVNYWMGQLSTIGNNSGGTTGQVPEKAPFLNGPLTDLLKELSEHHGLPKTARDAVETQSNLSEQYWKWSSVKKVLADGIRECIKSVTGALLGDIARLCSAFDVDLILVSGKPSELLDFQKIVYEVLPLSKEAIRFAKGYPVGQFYPGAYTKEGRITDAKSVTVVGAALYRAFAEGIITGVTWNLQYGLGQYGQYQWGTILANAQGNVINFTGSPYQFRDDGVTDVTVPLGWSIGVRSTFVSHIAPSCVYHLAVKKGKQVENRVQPINLRLQKKPVDPQTGTEELGYEILGPEGYTDDNVELRLKTIVNGAFWMDEPLLSFVIPPKGNQNQGGVG